MQEIKEVVQSAHTQLAKAKKSILKSLDHPELSMVQLGISADFDRMLGKLQGIGGIHVTPDHVEEFPPILTENDGDPITVDDVNPDEETKALFLGKVDKLWKDVEVLSSEDVLKDYQSKEDMLVIRGVAKRANVADFADAELNIFFIDEVKKAVAQKNADDAEHAKVTEQLNNDAVIEDLRKEVSAATNKRNALEADLKEAQAKGDKSTKKEKELAESLQKDLDAADEYIKGLNDKLTAAGVEGTKNA